MRLGVDIGGTKIKLGLLDEDRRVVAQRTAKLGQDRCCRAVLTLAAGELDALLRETGLPRIAVKSCGMGVPGTVDESGSMAVKVPNLGWENEPCRAIFEALTGIPTRLMQDSRAAALGEYLAGAGQGHRLVICVTLGTGIGTGIVYDGRVFGGALGGAGELGHIPVPGGNRPCGCGRTGCLENYVAGKGLALTANERLPECGGALRAEDVFRLAGGGNAVAKGILREAVETLGQVLVGAVNLMSPDALLLSGGISAQRALYTDPLIQYIRSHGYSLSVSERLLLDVAALGEDAPMIGAALLGEGRWTEN